MDTVQNQNIENSSVVTTGHNIEDKARDIGRKADTASARLQNSWEDATAQVKSRIGTTTEQVRYKLQVASEKAKQQLGVAKEKTVAKSHDARVRVAGEVQTHPVKTVALAFGAGALVGLLIRRGR
jgi:ElaB/YqjD/DUF883 family membrane-anchored ribosome-binding protein